MNPGYGGGGYPPTGRRRGGVTWGDILGSVITGGSAPEQYMEAADGADGRAVPLRNMKLVKSILKHWLRTAAAVNLRLIH